MAWRGRWPGEWSGDWEGTEGGAEACDVKVSWVALDTAAAPCDVRVSWVCHDTAADPCDVRVSWLCHDTAATPAEVVEPEPARSYAIGAIRVRDPIVRRKPVSEREDEEDLLIAAIMAMYANGIFEERRWT